MTGIELSVCLSSVFCSSVSQLFIKSASTLQVRQLKTFLLLGIGCTLQLTAVFFVVLALRTLQLTQLIPFASLAYLLVPIGSSFVFKEVLLPRFWLGALLIVVGVLCINS